MKKIKVKLIKQSRSTFLLDINVNSFIEENDIRDDELIDIKYSSCISEYADSLILTALIIYRVKE